MNFNKRILEVGNILGHILGKLNKLAPPIFGKLNKLATPIFQELNEFPRTI